MERDRASRRSAQNVPLQQAVTGRRLTCMMIRFKTQQPHQPFVSRQQKRANRYPAKKLALSHNRKDLFRQPERVCDTIPQRLCAQGRSLQLGAIATCFSDINAPTTVTRDLM
jgi:hypothetical protein